MLDHEDNDDDGDEEDDDDEFRFEYDPETMMGDEEDQARLAQMTERERELVRIGPDCYRELPPPHLPSTIAPAGYIAPHLPARLLGTHGSFRAL